MKKGMPVKSNYQKLLSEVSHLLEEARRKTVRQINTVITQTYWEVGRLIVEEEQKGKERAKYGEELVKRLSKDLTKRFGKGFTIANVKNMRQLYLNYPKLYAVSRESAAPEIRYALRTESSDEKSYALRSQLTWTHFRILMRVSDEHARQFYKSKINKVAATFRLRTDKSVRLRNREGIMNYLRSVTLNG